MTKWSPCSINLVAVAIKRFYHFTCLILNEQAPAESCESHASPMASEENLLFSEFEY